MRWLRVACLAALMTLPAAPAAAAEQGLIIRAADLMAQPFLDAAKAGPVAPNQPVTILERRGGWMRVDAGGRAGWVRMLNVRLASAGTARPTAGGSGGIATLLRTGSSGKTVTTGVKGMGEEDIRNAAPDYAELAQLGTLGVDAAQARDNALKNALKEPAVEYLKAKGTRK
jgi:hypothetical protein